MHTAGLQCAYAKSLHLAGGTFSLSFSSASFFFLPSKSGVSARLPLAAALALPVRNSPCKRRLHHDEARGGFSLGVGSRQWPEVYDSCHTFLAKTCDQI